MYWRITAGAAATAAWLYLLFGRGGFWRIREAVSATKPAPAHRKIAVVIPARDEAEVIGRAVASLASQNYPGEVSIFVVDDHSADDTANAVRRALESATVIPAKPLEPGWTGKLWALSCGLEHALDTQPDYLLLTDADIVHAPGNVSGLVARAESKRLDLASLMVKLRCESAAERALVPAFLFFFLKLYPPAWIARPGSKTAGAAGGCILIRPSALARIGGIGAIRGELIDDCALARKVKRGGPVWMGISSSTRSIREYGSFAQIGAMISRTAFTQLRHSTPLLAGILAGLGVLYLMPPALFLAGGNPVARGLGLAAWLAMSAAYLPAVRFYGRSIVWAPLLPLVALFYMGATLHSAVQYWRGRGGAWKGRVQNSRGLALQASVIGGSSNSRSIQPR